MAEISELETRITAALDRIAKGIENRPAPIAVPEEPDTDLVEELEVERATNARLVASREKYVAQIERMETRVARLTDRLEEIELENRRMKQVIGGLRENNTALRAANADHQGAGEAINAALAAELDDLKAARAADIAEMDEILAELEPLVKEA